MTDLDKRIWDEELAEFIPDRIYDGHVHCIDEKFCLSKPGDDPPEYNATQHCPVKVLGREGLDEVYAQLLPGREIHYLLMGWVFRRNDFEGHNAWVAGEAADDPKSAALMLVHPSFSPEKVAADIDRFGFRGLKPYRFYTSDDVNCRITDMLPEPLIELANERELMVTLHLGRKLGVADEVNIRDLLDLAERYPKVKWNLAHMARSSIAWPIEKAIDRIKDVPNFWYDFSSVMHSDVFTIAFRNLRFDRIMFGSDFPCDLIKGVIVSFGYGWELLEDRHLAAMNIQHCDPRPTFSAYETLRACRRACKFEGYGKSEIEDLFYNNATKLLGVQ
jgi:predicted TIM-barrel fold metal-dependent hydrolase